MALTIASTDVGGTGLSTVGTNGQVLTSNGTTLSWQTPSAGTSFSGGTTGFTPNTATTGTVTLAGTLNIANGGTGLTSFTAGQIHYGSFSQSANLFWDSANNRLGIGTSSPSTPLQITGTTASTNLYISATTGATFGQFGNTGSTTYVGTDSSTGGTITGTVYASFIWGQNAYPLIFGVNNAERMRISSTGDVSVGNAIAATNVQFALNGVANKAQRIKFQESGADKWLLGQGAATETSAFELYNAAGTVVISVNRSTNNITLSNNILNSSGRLMVPQTNGVIQVVNATSNTQYSTTSASIVSTGFSATITPSSTSSKILVIYGCGGIESNGGAGIKGSMQVWRGGSPVFIPSSSILYNTAAGAGPACTFIDSPATTSAVTYTLYFLSAQATFYVGTNGSSNSFTLMEISQ